MVEINYNAGPTMQELHNSDAFYRGILGPVGSGKSVGCCFELFKIACQQKPSPDGIRRTRMAVIRNTYRELEDTTIKTWVDWFPEDSFGKLNKQSMTQVVRFNDVECEVLFRALDRPDHVKKLLSLELTMGWINEAREVPKSIVDALGDRVERYPARKDGGCTRAGVIMDTNPPDEDHWWYRLAEENRPNDWDFWRQPGGLIERDGEFFHNPDAENIANLPVNYYTRRMGGKKEDHIRVYYCAQYGFVLDGKPVHPDYNDSVHCPGEIFSPVRGVPITIGVDFGLTPAAILTQRLPNGQIIVIDEVVTEDFGIQRFTEMELLPKLNTEYTGFEVQGFGDPAGNQKAQTDERTCFQIMNAVGVSIVSAMPNNDDVIRREAVSGPLRRMIDGKPGFLISPKCKILRKGLAGGYSFKRVQVSGDERFKDKPDKNKYSHPVEALEYGLVGLGEGKQLIHKEAKKVPESFLPGLSQNNVRNSSTGWMG